MSVLRTVALSTNSVAQSVDPLLQQQFLTLSPANSGFTGAFDTSASHGQHTTQNGAHGLGVPSGAMLGSTIHDPFGASPSSSYPYDSLSFGHMDTAGSGPSGMGGFGDFANGTTSGPSGHYSAFAPPEDLSTGIPEENIPREITPIVDTEMPPSDAVGSTENCGVETKVKTENA